jgi:putative flavoprotein involved in K+ transport
MRLLTPNWMTRLPGQHYDGDDPDGYMSAAEVAAFIGDYAQRDAAPVLTHAAVTSVTPDGDGYHVASGRGDWRCRAIVLANGAFGKPVVPRLSAQVPAGVAQWSARRYRHPAQLDEGGVLVVGASATGVQLAQEIQRSGRQVTLAVGEHVRLPRLYRGRDIQWWMLASGVLDQRIEQADDPVRARRVPSPQLVGTPERATLDLNVLRAEGVDLVGRLAGIRDGRALFSGSLRNACALADLKMNRLLDGIDAWARRSGIAESGTPGERASPTLVAAVPRMGLALGSDVRSVIWATGFRPDYDWLQVPVLGQDGELRHDRGIVARPGLYALGLPYLRRRKSSFIHGAEDDVLELSTHLAAHLDSTARARFVGIAAHGPALAAGMALSDAAT